jgi:hypothetical protein
MKSIAEIWLYLVVQAASCMRHADSRFQCSSSTRAFLQPAMLFNQRQSEIPLKWKGFFSWLLCALLQRYLSPHLPLCHLTISTHGAPIPCQRFVLCPLIL